MDTNDILTAEETAELLKVSVGWIHAKTRSRSRNPLPCFRPRKACVGIDNFPSLVARAMPS